MADQAPATCPECGRAVAKRRQLFRRRLSFRLVAIGLVVMLVGRSVWAIPQVERYDRWIRLVPSSVIALASPLLGPVYLTPRNTDTRRWLSHRLVEDYHQRAWDGVQGRWCDWVFTHGAATGASVCGIDASAFVTQHGKTEWKAIYVGDIFVRCPSLDSVLDALNGLLEASKTVDPDGWIDNGGADGAMMPVGWRYVLVGAPKRTTAGVVALVDDVRAAMSGGDRHTGRPFEGATPNSGADNVVRACYRVSDVLGEVVPGKPSPSRRLVRALAARVQPDEWRINGGEVISATEVGDVLVIQAPRAAHREIDAALAQMRRDHVHP
jgi:hypothetical protein